MTALHMQNKLLAIKMKTGIHHRGLYYSSPDHIKFFPHFDKVVEDTMLLMLKAIVLYANSISYMSLDMDGKHKIV